jgi:hypothetical protein
MRLIIHNLKALRCHMGIDLRGDDAGVAEHLLDGAKVGSAGEQVGGERVA